MLWYVIIGAKTKLKQLPILILALFKKWKSCPNCVQGGDETKGVSGRSSLRPAEATPHIHKGPSCWLFFHMQLLICWLLLRGQHPKHLWGWQSLFFSPSLSQIGLGWCIASLHIAIPFQKDFCLFQSDSYYPYQTTKHDPFQSFFLWTQSSCHECSWASELGVLAIIATVHLKPKCPRQGRIYLVLLRLIVWIRKAWQLNDYSHLAGSDGQGEASLEKPAATPRLPVSLAA